MSAVYTDLTLPLPGSRTARDALSRALARLPADLHGLQPSALATPAGRAALEVVQSLVARATAAPREAFAGALLAALRRPTVGALARCLRDDLRAGGPGHRTDAFAVELAATLATELAMRGVLRDRVTVLTPPTRWLCLGARRRVQVPKGTASVTITDEGLWAHTCGQASGSPWADASGPGHDADISESTVLSMEDNNPFAIYGLSAEDPPNAVDLGAQPASTWVSTLQQCLALTERHLPEVRREIDLDVQVIVPIGVDPEIHRSASYRQALGKVYLSLHPSLMTMTEALIHEAQHNKLHAVMEVDPLLLNGTTERFRSPLRRDPRPLKGLLLAVHAFLPVERLYEAMVEAGDPRSGHPAFLQRLTQIRSVNRDAATTVLSHARTTPAGAALLEEIQGGIARST